MTEGENSELLVTQEVVFNGKQLFFLHSLKIFFPYMLLEQKSGAVSCQDNYSVCEIDEIIVGDYSER